MTLRDLVRNGQAVASIGFGLAGIVIPSPLARLTGTSREEARELGFRDLAIGIAIVASPRVGLAQRALVDAGDAATFAGRKPWVSVVALGSALAAAYAATR